MPSKNTIFTELAARCVNGQGIAIEYLPTARQQYDNTNQNQTNGGGVVDKYLFYGMFQEGKLTSRVRTITVWVQDDGGANENAYIEPESLEGIFRGQVEAYLDGLAAIKDYQIEKVNITKKSATVKVAVVDAAGRKIITKIAEQDAQGVFTSYDITTGTW